MPNAQLYFLALIPPEPLLTQIKALKEEMRDRYGAGHALKSPAHITLRMPFRWPAGEEAMLIEVLQRFSQGIKPFPVMLDGFDCFAPRVLFCKVVHPPPIVELAESLQYVLQTELGVPPRQPPRPVHPHLTIATRYLTEEAFQRAWPEFRDRPLSASFLAESLFLLKHNGKYWDVYREFAFVNSNSS